MEDLQNIVKGCVNNEHRYQKMLYESFYAYALKMVFRYVYKYDDAVNVVNDGFVKVFRYLDHFECQNTDDLEKLLAGWIKKIMINTAIDELRKNHFQPEIKSLQEGVWDIRDENPDIEQQMLYKELISQLKNLSPVYRAVFNMAVIDGYLHQEIAAILGISVGTSKSNLFKAKAKLQKILINNKTQV